MRICIPTRTDEGLKAHVHGHFGNAPWFTIVDVESGELESLANEGKTVEDVVAAARSGKLELIEQKRVCAPLHRRG